MHPLQILGCFVPFIPNVLAILPSQYCYSSKAVPSSFCVSFSQSHNDTSQGTDLYIALSSLPSASGGGWLAVGSGDHMADSFMLILWADKKRENVAVSVRTSLTHTEPYLDKTLPQIKVLEATASKHSSHKVLLVCYSCDEWTTIDMKKKKHPWIWASNHLEEFQTSDTTQHISTHQLHDSFFVDMTTIPSTSQYSTTPYLPKIEGSINSGTWDKNRLPSRSSKFSIAFWHGATMLAAFMGIMMPSAIHKKWSSKGKLHAISQSFGALLVIAGLMFGIFAFRSSGLDAGPHQLVGSFIAILIMVQIYLGLQIYGKDLENSAQNRTSHKWVGRCVLVLGIADCGLGLELAGTGRMGLAIWFMCGILEVVIYLLVRSNVGDLTSKWEKVASSERVDTVMERSSHDEEANCLTDLVEEEKD
jgi:hypothetical protein